MTLVVDASVVVAALLHDGATGEWAEEVILSDDLAAPHLMPAQVADIMRRAVDAGEISSDAASLAHADLLRLRVALFPYECIDGRAWELRENLTTYDAWHVALAEYLSADPATLDARLSHAPGPTCGFMVPPRSSWGHPDPDLDPPHLWARLIRSSRSPAATPPASTPPTPPPPGA